MRVRPATLMDLAEYARLGEQFIAASPLGKEAGHSAEETAQFLVSALDNPNVGMWLTEKDGQMIGICGAIAYPLYFRPSYIIVQELWWWLTPEARGSGAGQMMFKEIERWAKDKNASALTMIALENESVEKVSKFYRRAGFRPLERAFFKGLE